MSAKREIRTYRDDAGAWRWSLVAGRDRVIEQGGAHKTKREAEAAAAERVAELDANRKALARTARIQAKEAKRGSRREHRRR